MRGKLRKTTKPNIFNLANIFGPKLGQSLLFKLPPSKVFLNKQLQQQIQKMKLTAAHYHMAYLTANQVQTLHRLFLLNKQVHPQFKLETNTHPSFGKPEDFVAYINPEILKGENMQEMQQSCLIFPFVKFIVPRYHKITLKFRDEQKDYRTQEYTGSVSQLIQHCLNHLDGELLLDYSLSKGKFFIQKDCIPFFPKTTFLMKEYSYRLKVYESSAEKTGQQREQFVKMKEDYMQRMKKEYQKQSIIYSQKLAKKDISII